MGDFGRNKRGNDINYNLKKIKKHSDLKEMKNSQLLKIRNEYTFHKQQQQQKMEEVQLQQDGLYT